MPTKDELVVIFQQAAQALPYYKAILEEKKIEIEKVDNYDAFIKTAPVLVKEDIFPKFSLKEMVNGGIIPNFSTAILSSGTSGVFSYGLVTPGDIEKQKLMVDFMMDSFFRANESPPVIINALPMGVSFVSSYPVIPTSVRTDIALEAIKLFGQERQVVIVTDPHILKKLLEEGEEKNVNWSTLRISSIIGGNWFSDSFVQYAQGLLNKGLEVGQPPQNLIFSTMGVTEVGLNLFTATPDLIALRSIIQAQEDLQNELFSRIGAVPTLFYSMSTDVYLEIINQDVNGVGDLVVTHLDTTVTPQLLRYATGDRVKILDRAILEKIGISLLLPNQIYAMVGRTSELVPGVMNQNDVKELLYRDHELANCITGHFVMTEINESEIEIKLQLKPGVESIKNVNIPGVVIEPVAYHQFPRDITVSYEHKWKHLH